MLEKAIAYFLSLFFFFFYFYISRFVVWIPPSKNKNRRRNSKSLKHREEKENILRHTIYGVLKERVNIISHTIWCILKEKNRNSDYNWAIKLLCIVEIYRYFDRYLCIMHLTSTLTVWFSHLMLSCTWIWNNILYSISTDSVLSRNAFLWS